MAISRFGGFILLAGLAQAGLAPPAMSAIALTQG
jgi:hypothetical protein